ncbi:Galactokinase [Propionibacterium freudenreichii]|uniref:Galactokinase n=5 Tax=Propionibacterium freudenreichii TaxID=1744 RepID=D7GFZ5_PROFC|nr:galactokinase [Propionibacterium freudenreichii]MDN5961600.1 galactokinase [Propionibacterium sp.]CBL57456.1 Galactokinase [Propionibacterium freudenreichii subsp. shermanii CIRM-BIA1]CEP27577.1 Galactokinase [Propionibacterium freudenreichii subsp. freudenreichii]CEG88479.1 Galactokinase [Propionibacterium freudenreichii]CEH04561.1 Galactokinase [Propionibacterium freudenreichii]
MDAQGMAEIFPQHFNARPTGVWSAPGRFNLMGEHTDYNRGFCLPVPLDARTFLAARARDDERIRLVSLNIEGDVDVELSAVDAERPGGWGAYAAGVLWALRQAGHPVRGVDMVIGSTLLIGAGLSSSAALECSVAAAASDLFGLGLLADDAGRKQLAVACQTAENEIALAPTGGVDQTSALRGSRGHALLIDFLTDVLRPVPYLPQDAGVEVYIIDTGTRHSLSAGHYGNRRAECEQIARMLGVDYLRRIDEAGLPEAIRRLNDPTLAKRLRHVVTENARGVRMADDLEAGDWRAVAQAMTTAHYSMRDDLEVSVPEVDLAVDTALAAGAWGARLVGGGFGGCVLAVMPRGRGDELLHAVSDAYDRAGYATPQGFVGEAGSPAARDL